LTLGTVLGALTLPLVAAIVCGSIGPEAGEAPWLRWLRVLDDHPVRGYLAGLLLLLAFLPGREREPPARS